MGCCESSFLTETHPEKDDQHHNNNSHNTQNPPFSHPSPSGGADGAAAGGVPSFSEFSFSDLKAATNNFSCDSIVSESGEKAPNIVYKGRLQNRRWIAVKKFTKMAWPDPKQFAVTLFLLLAFCFFSWFPCVGVCSIFWGFCFWKWVCAMAVVLFFLTAVCIFVCLILWVFLCWD